MWLFITLGLFLLGNVWLARKLLNWLAVPDTATKIESMELLWNIQNASVKLKDGYFKSMVTEHFYFASRKWYLELKCKDHNITVHLMKTDSQLPSFKKIYWGAGIQTAEGKILFDWFDINKESDVRISIWNNEIGWIGPQKLYLLQKRKLLLPNDVLTFFVRLSVHPTPFWVIKSLPERHKDQNRHFRDATDEDILDEETEKIMSQNFKVLKNLSKSLKDFYLEDKYPDVKIIVGNETFGAHRMILIARSPVLSAMFSHSMLESKTGEIRVGDCDPKDFAVFLRFLYSGTVDNLTSDNVISVYRIADKYEVFDLMETCTRYMLCTLTVHSICNVIALAVKHGERKLLEDATVFFLEHAEQIFDTDEWENFLRENPNQANEILIRSYRIT